MTISLLSNERRDSMTILTSAETSCLLGMVVHAVNLASLQDDNCGKWLQEHRRDSFKWSIFETYLVWHGSSVRLTILCK
jgi:hypothetical protein